MVKERERKQERGMAGQRRTDTGLDGYQSNFSSSQIHCPGLTDPSCADRANDIGYATLPDTRGDGEQTPTQWQIENRLLAYKQKHTS